VQQLSWTDDMMLRAERPDTPMQIQKLLIYDPSTAPAGKVTFTGILADFDARLHLAHLPAAVNRAAWRSVHAVLGG
jgi:diacylglycerol O-acyltransferase